MESSQAEAVVVTAWGSHKIGFDPDSGLDVSVPTSPMARRAIEAAVPDYELPPSSFSLNRHWRSQWIAVLRGMADALESGYD